MVNGTGHSPRRRLPALTAAALAAATLVGCGGTAATSTGGEATVDSAFIGKADAWCARTVAGYHAAQGSFPARSFDPLHPDPAQLPQVGRFLARGNHIRDGMPAGLRALGEPTTGAAQWDRVRDLFLRTVHLAHAEITAALAGNTTAFATAAGKVRDLGKQIGTADTAAGFPDSTPFAQLF